MRRPADKDLRLPNDIAGEVLTLLMVVIMEAFILFLIIVVFFWMMEVRTVAAFIIGGAVVLGLVHGGVLVFREFIDDTTTPKAILHDIIENKEFVRSQEQREIIWETRDEIRSRGGSQ